MRRILIALAVAAPLFLAGCLYRQPIFQGNLLEQKNVEQLAAKRGASVGPKMMSGGMDMFTMASQNQPQQVLNIVATGMGSSTGTVDGGGLPQMPAPGGLPQMPAPGAPAGGLPQLPGAPAGGLPALPGAPPAPQQ